MVATPVKIGPFTGGLNSYSGPSSIGDNEVSDIQNFDIDLDGSLYSRAPITVKVAPPNIPLASGAVRVMGFFIDTNGDRYMIVSGHRFGGIFARNEETGAWITITTTIIALAYVQYNNTAWFIQNGGSANGSWTPAGGFVTVSAIPKGTTATVYKERLFIGGNSTNPNRVYFSDAANFSTFNTSVNFFDVRAGDGENVVCLYTFNDVVVAFKDNSTYVFSYDSSPSRGSVRSINGAVGASNAYCVVEYENSLYVLHKDKLYQVSNWTFTIVNLKVPFEYIIKFTVATYGPNTFPSINVMADRILVHYYDANYVFNLRNGTWTKWDIQELTNYNYFVEVPRKDASEPERYYGGCRRDGVTGPQNRAIFEWRPVPTPDRTESMTSYVVTKAYDFNVPYTFKRLFWWGVDILSKKDLSYKVHPIAVASSVTHQQLAAYNHQDIVGSHLQPLDVVIDVSDSLVIDNAVGSRMFVKLLKGMRFRQIQFTITGGSDGSNLQGPFRVYSIIGLVDNKALVTAEVS